MSQQSFPKALQPYQAIFEQSKVKFVKITHQRNTETKIWQSKFGGMPFLPHGIAYPKNDIDGKDMYLLAQINFEEIPEGIDYLPKKGILQFYISNDDLYGMDLDAPNEQKGFKVLYFPEIDINNFQRDLPQLPEPKYTPLNYPLQAHRLTFEIAEEMINRNDARFHKFFGEQADTLIDLSYEDEEIREWMQNNLSNAGHKIGGYAYFTQEDPREYNEDKLETYNTLLLQIDSIDDICWGDLGIANFFINQEKLKKLDFSDVLYNWDCG
ncbi:MAG: YwqG family protein [Raineya sp.]